MNIRIIFAMLALSGVSMVHAQSTPRIQVLQHGRQVGAVGTATVAITSKPTLCFENGNAVMKVNGNTVCKVPTSDGGQLGVYFSDTQDESLNKLSKTVGNEYATLYSPFQLTVPTGSDVEVYAPSYEAPTLRLNSTTKVAEGTVIPAGTALILKNNGTIDFAFSYDQAASITSALSGSALKIAKPEESGKTVYTLGHETNTNEYGFFAYQGSYMNPGLAYLFVPTVGGSSAKAVSFCFDDATAIDEHSIEQSETLCIKRIENGRVIIMKDGTKYNLNGQKVF